MSFASLGLAEPLLRAVEEYGYTTPTPIQTQAIPVVMSGADLLGGAQTGTGKTAGFTLPTLHRLMQKPAVRDTRGRLPIRALILTPTRELAAQVEESVRTYGKYAKLTSMVMFGGVGMQPQIDKLRKGVDILVATPGRLLDHHQQGTLDLSHVEIFILDEADRMLDMGFIHDIKKVLAVLPAKKQSLLFSATFSDEIKALADRLLNKPELIEVARRNTTAETIAQKVHPVGREMKKDLLCHLIKDNDWHQVLVFTRMKHGANRLVEHLEKQGISAMAIHGNKSQSARTKALAEFKTGELQVLVATDIAARGIDIDQLPHVVNYELPNVPEDYVHRIGRTGRAGAQGEAVSLVCVDENGFLRDIEKLIKREIPKEIIPGFAPSPNEKPEPIVLGRMVIGEGAGRGGCRGGRPGGAVATPAGPLQRAKASLAAGRLAVVADARQSPAAMAVGRPAPARPTRRSVEPRQP
jgi:ATP-dependent RNA helicase RhlE